MATTAWRALSIGRRRASTGIDVSVWSSTLLGVTSDSPPPQASVVVTPLYADRDTGHSFANAFEMIDAYLARYAEVRGEPIEPLDATGYTQIKRGSAYIGINVLEENGVLMLLAPIMEVPARNREGFYRKLLELSFLTTSDAAFAIDGKKDLVYVRALRRLSALDYEELDDLLQTVGTIADEWDGELQREFG